MGQSEPLLLVGAFAKRAGLSASALRYYDDVGLLKPVKVDEATGYRYYSIAQLEQAELICFLRSLEMSVSDLRTTLAASATGSLAAHLKGYRRDVRAQLDEKEQMLTEIKLFAQRQLESPVYGIQLKEVPAHAFLSLRRRTPVAALLDFMTTARSSLLTYLNELDIAPSGPWFTLYHNADYSDVEVDVEICVPTPHPAPSVDEIRQGSFPAQTQAWTLHEGSYEQIGQAYRALQGWLGKHGYTPIGPMRDVCLIGPAEVDDPAAYRTEVARPVRRLSRRRVSNESRF